jgi:hypothetical protein
LRLSHRNSQQPKQHKQSKLSYAWHFPSSFF